MLEFSGTGNKQTQCINFPIMDNEVALEEMKTITLALSVPDGQRDMVEGDLPQTHIIILDDDGKHMHGVLTVHTPTRHC